MTTAEYISLAALIVSIASAFYAYRVPVRAEDLKARSAQRDRELNVFTLLMSERGRWGSPTMLAALNAVKVIFRDLRREDLANFFVNPIDQQEAAVKTAQVQRAFAELSTNTAIISG